ncbi:hypothetical protein SLA2020_248610 [Shorea laevis]
MSWLFWILGLAILTVAASQRAHAISCAEVLNSLTPCQSYLTGGAKSPTVACCLSLGKVNKAASTTQDRRDVCFCFKNAAPVLGGILTKAKSLVQLCALIPPLPIDPNIDCNT